MAGAGERGQVSGGHQQRRAQDGPESGHGLDDFCLGMLGEHRRDLRVEFCDALLEGQEVAASSAMMPAAMSWPGRVICWACAAVTALAATPA